MLPLIVFLSLIVGFLSPAQATELYEPFQSVRQLGMGGVYIFNENDASGFLQNPAYTCYTKGLNWTIFNFGFGLGDLQAIRDLTTNSSSLPNPSSFGGLTPYFGKNVWFDTGGITSFVLPCFGFAGTFNGVANFKMHNPAFPVMETYYLTEYGMRAGFAIPFSPVLSVGLDVKRMSRTGGTLLLGPETLVSLSGSNAIQTLVSNLQNSGTGYGIDTGVVSRFSTVPFNPTMSLAWRDVGSMAFQKTNGTTAPDRQKDNLVLGMTVDGSVPLLGFAAGFEYRHITDTGEQIGKKLHLGAEATLAFLDARAGFYQGYTTYGVGLDFWLVQFDAAWYKVERGAYPGQTPDERFQIGLMMDLEFDPNFNLTDAGGRKRRLKQRR